MERVYRAPRLSEPDWERVPVVDLAHTGWLKPCGITARGQCCRDEGGLWVRMEAEESAIRAELTGKLDAVCKDSCLEFFFAPRGDDDRYFNFEWNPLGTLCLGFGAERPTRVRQIVKEPAMFRPAPFCKPGGWGIRFYVPLSFLRIYFPGYELEGEAACNFYKCGDATEIPHYLAWAPLSSSTPDFHRRQDFGRLLFE